MISLKTRNEVKTKKKESKLAFLELSIINPITI